MSKWPTFCPLKWNSTYPQRYGCELLSSDSYSTAILGFLVKQNRLLAPFFLTSSKKYLKTGSLREERCVSYFSRHPHLYTIQIYVVYLAWKSCYKSITLTCRRHDIYNLRCLLIHCSNVLVPLRKLLLLDKLAIKVKKWNTKSRDICSIQHALDFCPIACITLQHVPSPIQPP